jgi:hypothetical protein
MTKPRVATLLIVMLVAIVALYKAQKSSTSHTQDEAVQVQQGTPPDTTRISNGTQGSDALDSNPAPTPLVNATENDPVYNGKTWSQWLTEVNYGQPQDLRNEAARAIREIGPVMVPRLLADLDFSQNLGSPGNQDDRARRACWAFKALGTNASAAAPQLLSLFDSNPGYTVAAYAAVLGREAIPQLIASLGSSGDYVRWNAASALLEFEPSQTKEAIPLLVQGWDDPNGNVSSRMRSALQTLDPVAYEQARQAHEQ